MSRLGPLRLALLVVGLGLTGLFLSPRTAAAVTNPYQGGGCTQWAWERWHQLNSPDLPSNLGMAKDWANKAQADGLPVGSSAAPRSVAVFAPGTGYCATTLDCSRYTDPTNGHVAFVESVNPDGTFVTSNYWNPSYTTPDYVTFYPDSRIKFIYPQATPTPTPTPKIAYVSEGIAAFIYTSQEAGSIPLYRLYNPSAGHFYTTDQNEANAAASSGYVQEGVAGYVFGSQSSGTTPLYRLYSPGNGQHFYTTNQNEANAAASSGYVQEGVAAYVFLSSSTMPFYRLTNPSTGQHFYTTDLGERDIAISQTGFRSENIAAFIYTSQEAGSIPLYRLYNPSAGHFYTTDQNEANAAASSGYVQEGVAGYVFGSQSSGTTPLYRLYSPGNGQYFYTTNQNEANAAASSGYVQEGVAAYVFPSSSTMPFYRLTNPSTGQHFYTTDLGERDYAIWGQAAPGPTDTPTPTPTATATATPTPSETFTATPTSTPGPPVGGIAELPDMAGASAEEGAAVGDGSGWSTGGYAALVGGLAAAAVAITAGVCYARRRWLRRRA